MRQIASVIVTCCVLVIQWQWLMPEAAHSQDSLDVARPFLQQDRSQSLRRNVRFVNPPEGDTQSTTNLHVVEVVNRLNGVDLKHRSYNCTLVGPTLRIRPGQVLNVRLQNDLRAAGNHASNARSPHGFNITNLHTHGLHVSPKPPADDVFKQIGPGESFNYEFQIRADHPPGTYWYHAHKHGATALHLASGMSGALIVEGGLDEIPEIAAAQEKIFVLQQFVYREVAGSPAFVDPDLLYSGAGVNVEAINGVVTPTIVMRPGEVQRWRLIHAGTNEAIDFDAEGMSFYEIAVDGLATGRMEEKNSIELYPGNRSDILVQAPRSEGTRLVYSLIRDADKAIRQRRTERTNLLRVVIEGETLDMPFPSPEALHATRAFDDGDVPADDEIDNRRELRFSQEGDRFLINGKEFDPSNIEQTIDLGSAEEWTLISENGVHPFHIHVNPFAVKPSNSEEPWVWRDTIAVRRRHPVTFRTRFETFPGKTVLHCHNLVHEDLGMMQAIEIVERPSNEASRRPRVAPRWSASDSSKRRFSSDDYRGQRSLLVFHRGLSCLHCAEQLDTLKSEYESFRCAGIEIVAISPYLPRDSESLRFLADFPFPVLVDRELRTFRSYDCVDKEGSPLHGLFLVDRRNHIVLEHRSEIAVADPAKLVLHSSLPQR